MAPADVNVNVISTERVFPNVRTAAPVRTRLSIIDASVARFSPCGAIWYHTKPRDPASLDPEALRSSLEQTLNSYPQWTGQVRMVPFTGEGVRNDQRYGRLEITYGTANDPGVAFVIAETASPLKVALPGAGEPASFWQCDGMAREDVFLPSEPLASHNSLPEHQDACAAVQITRFSCGGTAIGLQMFHSLADAHALSYFMRDWSRVHEAAVAGVGPPVLSPIFEPALLDQSAVGSLDSSEPDLAVLEKAHSLPLHRFDWWASKEGSGFGPAACEVPAPLQGEPRAQTIAANGQRLPWNTYDVMAPVSHTIVHYTSEQLQRVWEAALALNGTNVSRHDALVAHVWGLINRARGPEKGESDSIVHADVTFGLRKRVSPPLSTSWLGSPLQIAKISLPWSVASSTKSLPAIASKIKSTLASFTPEAIAAQIYSTAYELAPFRLWQAFLGREHMLVTSWAHTGVYDCDFGTGSCPRYVHPIMPLCDGCVQIMEGPPALSGVPGGNGDAVQGRRWYADGVDVALYVEKEATARLLQDPTLHL